MTSGSYQLFNCFNYGCFFIGLGVPPVVNKQPLFLIWAIFIAAASVLSVTMA
jgi:hypothetical protein